jgi:hypothetical protein
MNSLLGSIVKALISAAAIGAQTSTAYAVGPNCNTFTWQTVYTGGPSAVNVVIEGSLDGTTWATLDTSTVTGGEVRTFNSNVAFVRARMVSNTGGTTVSVYIIPKIL